MKEQPTRRVRSFIVRIWPSETKSGRWHISVICLPEGERVGFTDLGEALAFVRKQIESESVIPVSWCET